jgi:beta-phosphoglucomutase-like phosphatase (HAD superfamily)
MPVCVSIGCEHRQGYPPLSIRAFLFDMDGLLLDTESIHIRAYAELTSKLGRAQSHESLRQFIGHTHVVTCKWLIEEAGCRATMEELVEAEHARYFEILEEERPQPLPGVREMFDTGDRLKFGRALVSSSVKHQVDPTMQIVTDHLGKAGPWRDHFQAISTGDRVEARKPAPDLYLLAMKEMGLEPRECVAFEDSPAGITSALAAGLRVVAIPNLHLDADEVVQSRTPLVYRTLLDAATDLERILS